MKLLLVRVHVLQIDSELLKLISMWDVHSYTVIAENERYSGTSKKAFYYYSDRLVNFLKKNM